MPDLTLGSTSTAHRAFYGGLPACRPAGLPLRPQHRHLGRFDMHGHQLSLHLGEPLQTADTGRVGGKHGAHAAFRARQIWHSMAERLRAAGVAFVLEPQVRFADEPGEQWTKFFRDPFGNPIEVKGF